MLLGHRVIQVACGSRDAQTLALTDEGISGSIRILLSEFHFLVANILFFFLRVGVLLGRWGFWEAGSWRQRGL